jgi:ABC-type transport system involved in cytochrome c biogenesis permease component
VNFLPVISRELQVQARQPATNRMRWIAAAAVIAIWLLLMLASGHTTAHERAKITFIAISIVSLGGVMLAGVFQTADCLSEERREGTLGLLFLTDLRGYDVVLGKLASTSLHTFFALLAIMPVLALPLLMGGMTPGEFGRVSLVLVVTLYLSLAVGMLVSSISRDTRGAMVGTFLVMLLLAGVLPLLWGMAFVGKAGGRFEFLLLPCPAIAYQQAFDQYYSMGRGAGTFWKCLLTQFGLGTGCLIAACVLLPRVWQESGVREGPKSKHLSGAFNVTEPTMTSVLRDKMPFHWLVLRDRKMRRTATAVFLVLLGLWGVLFAGVCTRTGMAQGTSFSFALFLTYGLHLVLKCLVAVEVSRRLSEDRQSGALELLLVTPLPLADIVTGQVAGIWQTFRWQLAALVCVNLALLVFGLGEMRMGSEGAGIFTLIMLGGIGMLFLDCYAMTRVGMWMALTKKRHAKAFMATILRVMLPAWLAVVLVVFLGFAGAFRGGSDAMAVMVFFWFFIGAVVAVGQATMTAKNLSDHFREVVSLGRVDTPATAGNIPVPARAVDS